MDPLSQAVVGTLGAQSLSLFSSHVRNDLKRASLVGAIAGLTPDLDVLIRSSSDPLLALEFHRQFTHSLAFIPIGALIVAATLFGLSRLKRDSTAQFSWMYAYALAGYATHGLLDACTNYGTQLLWPFANTRISWNLISIIDPLFTLPLLGLAVFAIGYRSPRIVAGAIVFAFAYLGVGLSQRLTLEAHVQKIAETRGHVIERIDVKPSFANLILWRSVYESDGVHYTDALHRWPWSRHIRHYEGGSVPALNVENDFSFLPKGSVARNDIERFRWFSNGFLSWNPTDPTYIGDIRFAFFPTSTEALWGIVIPRDHPPQQHVDFISRRALSSQERAHFAQMLWGRDLLSEEPEAINADQDHK